jgi:hypothetical protein
MHAVARRSLAFALLAAALAAGLVAPDAGAGTLPSTTLYDKPYGYTITLPKAWRLIPRSVAEIHAAITALD